MLALVVEFRIRPPFIAAFAEAINANARTSLDNEPGCRRFDVWRDATDPGLFFLYELYEDQAALDAHLHAPHYLSMSAATAEWVDAKVVRRFVR